MFENIYCINTTEMCANDCLTLESPGCPAFPRLGKFSTCPGQQLFMLGIFQNKTAENAEGWGQVGKDALDHSLTCISQVLQLRKHKNVSGSGSRFLGLKALCCWLVGWLVGGRGDGVCVLFS